MVCDVLCMQVEGVVVLWGQFLDFVGCQSREDDTGEDGLVDEDLVALVLLIEFLEGWLTVDREEGVSPVPEQVLLGAGDVAAGVEVGAELYIVHVGCHGEDAVVWNVAVAVDQGPEGVEELVVAGADEGVVDGPVAQTLVML